MSQQNGHTDGRSRSVTLRVFRYSGEGGTGPRFDTYTLDAAPGMTVLSALFQVRREQDSSLAFRFSCRGAVCGACAMTINGRCALACRTQVAALGSPEVVVEPLPNLAVIRDLIVDMGPFWEKYRRVRPWLHEAYWRAGTKERHAPPLGPTLVRGVEAGEGAMENTAHRAVAHTEMGGPSTSEKAGATPAPPGDHLQSPADAARVDDYANCILCACCYGSCPVLRRKPEYLGPAALGKLARFLEDSRDHRPPGALTDLDTESDGMWGCHMLHRCSSACPKDVGPDTGVAVLRRRLARYRLGRKP
jgi:succinate dehydrogenase / fumarate reductase, iron-sulfur subunit